VETKYKLMWCGRSGVVFTSVLWTALDLGTLTLSWTL